MKLANFLKALLITQLASYAWAVQIMYSSSRAGVSGLAGLAVLMPIGIFLILSVVNVPLLIIYLYKRYKQRSKYDYVLIGLALTLLILTFLWLRPLA